MAGPVPPNPGAAPAGVAAPRTVPYHFSKKQVIIAALIVVAVAAAIFAAIGLAASGGWLPALAVSINMTQYSLAGGPMDILLICGVAAALFLSMQMRRERGRLFANQFWPLRNFHG